MNVRTAVWRALRLRCPECGEGNISDGWLSTKASCPDCSADLRVETGYFLGAIYFNYGATVLIVLSAAIPLIFVAQLPTLPVIAVATLFCVGFPLWFFRYARSLWLALDHYYHVRRRESVGHDTQRSVVRPNASPSRGEIGCICALCHDRFRADAAHANRWGKCPSCFGDVLLRPTFPIDDASGFPQESSSNDGTATSNQPQRLATTASV